MIIRKAISYCFYSIKAIFTLSLKEFVLRSTQLIAKRVSEFVLQCSTQAETHPYTLHHNC